MSDNPTPFQGESMTCIMCGRVRKSDPGAESGWTSIDDLDGKRFYFCPGELPPHHEATPSDYRRAYKRIFEKIRANGGNLPEGSPIELREYRK